MAGNLGNPMSATLGEGLKACFAGKNFPLLIREVTSEPYFPFQGGTRASGTERSWVPGEAMGCSSYAKPFIGIWEVLGRPGLGKMDGAGGRIWVWSC